MDLINKRLATWAARVARVHIPEKDRRAVNRAQLATYYSNLPAGSLANIFNAGVLALVFAYQLPPLMIVSWLLAIGLTVSWRMKLRGAGLSTDSADDPALEIDRSLPGGILIGSLWAIGFIMMSTVAYASQMTLLGIVALGMMHGGVQALYSVPRIAVAFVLTTAVGVSIAFAHFASANEGGNGLGCVDKGDSQTG